jgi:hypothetical protein
MGSRAAILARWYVMAAALLVLHAAGGHAQSPEAMPAPLEQPESRELVALVNDAAERVRSIGAGIYGMEMDREFIEDLVSSAASLIAQQGAAAFDALRDPTGPFVFMDTYVFVDTSDGVEVVNAAQPSLEGRNIMDLVDLNGTPRRASRRTCKACAWAMTST